MNKPFRPQPFAAMLTFHGGIKDRLCAVRTLLFFLGNLICPQRLIRWAIKGGKYIEHRVGLIRFTRDGHHFFTFGVFALLASMFVSDVDF